MADRLRKDEASKLGEMLGYEVDRALVRGEQFPFQRIGKTLATRMVEKELIEPREVRRPSALGAFTVKGYELTHRGRILYGELCKEAGPNTAETDARVAKRAAERRRA